MKMQRLWKIFLSSIGAGLLIAIGGFVFLSYKQTSPILASFLFSLGLLTIISFQMYLFTGKVGYIFENRPIFLLDLLVCWIGNFLGAVGTGYLLRLTRYDLSEVVKTVVDAKLNDNLGSIFILSIFCGMMIYIAVEMQRKQIPNVFKLLGILLPVMVFIIAGFEHCVANMFYISYANAWSLRAFLSILVMSIGNGVGSLLLWGIGHFSNLNPKKSLSSERKEDSHENTDH